MKRISVRLSVFSAAIMLLLLAMAGAAVTAREMDVVTGARVKDAQTTALASAAAYGRLLDDAVEAGKLTIDDVVHPRLDEIKFSVKVEHARYRSLLSDYTDSHGIQQIEDAVVGSCSDCLFASGMMRIRLESGASGGYVPTTNSRQDGPPKGDATDPQLSRGKMIYPGAEPVAAAGYAGSGVLVQQYPRDTGELAWDVAAPIFVHGQHWGAFRVGVSQDRITAQRNDLIMRLSVTFGALVLLAIAGMFLLSRRMIRPLVALSTEMDRVSQSPDTSELAVKISVTDRDDEIGAMQRSVNRTFVSLHGAIAMIEARPHAPRLPTTTSDSSTIMRAP